MDFNAKICFLLVCLVTYGSPNTTGLLVEDSKVVALMMYLKQPSWIYCTCLWLATLAASNAQEVLQPKPDELHILNEDTGELFLSDQGYPALASQPIEVAALGRPLFPGMLYDCRKDTFIPGVTLWDKNSLIENLDTRPQLMTDLKFSSSDSLSSKSSLLDVSASLKASFLGGLVEVGGSAKFLHDTKSTNQQSRITMYYRETSRFEQLTMTHLGQITYPQVFDQKTATHVVTAVQYGAQSFMVFERTFSEEENKQEIEGQLNVMVKKIPGFSIEGEGALKMTDDDKKIAESIACTFYGDIRIEQNPTTYIEALEVYKKLPTIMKNNKENAVPIKVWLYPLSLLDTKAAQLEREISTRLVSDTEDIIEELGNAERTCNDLSRKTQINIFRDIKERLQSFQRSFSIYKITLLKAVARVLPAIRGGGLEEKSLEDILKIHYNSPFIADMLNQWLDHAKTELNFLSSQTKILEVIKTEDSDRLNSILLDPNIDVVVCLTFTSLKYEDPYLSTLKEFLKSDVFKEQDGEQKMVSVAPVRKWFNDRDVISKMRENLSLFKSFSEVNKDEKRYRFIISAISDPSRPGSSIYLYEKGNLTDTQFQPVSKPSPPEVKDVLKDNVSLKLHKSLTGETVQYRVEYRQVNEEQWHATNTADEDFTLTGLEFGKRYLIRHRIVGKVGVSEASDTIGSMLSEITCTAPPILNGEVIERVQEYRKDAILKYRCYQGFKPREGSPRCAKFGWTLNPECDEITCVLPSTIFGVKQINPAGKTIFRARERVEITCAENHWLRTREYTHSFTCRDDGQWDHQPVCEEIRCEVPRNQHVNSPYYYFSGDKRLGVKISYSCEAGYVQTAAQATCTLDGWTPNPLCAERMCAAPIIPNAEIVGLYRINSRIQYKCNTGFEPEQPVLITCNSRTEWTGIQQCTVKGARRGGRLVTWVKHICCEFDAPGLAPLVFVCCAHIRGGTLIYS